MRNMIRVVLPIVKNGLPARTYIPALTVDFDRDRAELLLKRSRAIADQHDNAIACICYHESPIYVRAWKQLPRMPLRDLKRGDDVSLDERSQAGRTLLQYWVEPWDVAQGFEADFGFCPMAHVTAGYTYFSMKTATQGPIISEAISADELPRLFDLACTVESVAAKAACR